VVHRSSRFMRFGGLALMGVLVITALAWRWTTGSRARGFDPLAQARAAGSRVFNREAPVPSMCYTKTEGRSNPCWTCHTKGVGANSADDVELQSEYAFSSRGESNAWSNLFVDRSAVVARIGDGEILGYVREDNYGPLREAMRELKGYPGYVPDLDLAAGFDEDGFARDGSGWRAVRYKPFPGTFWPTNGSTDDVFIRLPEAFRRDAGGRPSREVYRANLSVLEAALAADPRVVDASALRRPVEPLDERAAGLDLDGDGELRQGVAEIRGLPRGYAGQAAGVKVRRYVYPRGTEMLHSVRYLDPDQPSGMAARMKELRYARKVEELDDWAILRAYEREADDRDRGKLPMYQGTPDVGLLNDFGWQLQGFIEDAHGRLRVQTLEEHLYCMGCHNGLGVTVDQTFAFPRKVPGRAGWAPQDLRGIPDVPQVGHAEPETLVYLRRAGGGDEFRSNQELIERFLPGGEPSEAEVRRGAPGGDRDLAFLLFPSRTRALQLNKAYRALVLEQQFDRGRDTLLGPPANVHRKIENGSTELAASGRVFDDGRLHLDWSAVTAPLASGAAPP